MAAFLARPTTAPTNYEITDTGNSTMKVVVRLRPENEDEIRSNNQAVAKVLDEHVLIFDPSPDNSPSFSVKPLKRPILGRKHKDLRFAFDKVFDETASQVDIFEHTTKSIVDGVLEGINCSVFAYGATGAGKTYTMLGTVDSPGVMFLTMMELYKRINEVREEKHCDVAVSYCEVYNETIRDLLEPSGDLHLREDSQKGLVVAGLSRHVPTSANDVLRMLETGNENRTQHPTDANATSSRSHAVFQVFVNQKPRATGLSTTVMQAKMSLIDLAGSERATVTKNRGERMTEGANINRSLLALGNCINALAGSKDKSTHVPYRDSKLTRLLKDSLGGNCRTVMIANISPSGLHREDTYNTLRYADRAKQIKTKLVPNVLNVDYHVTRYRTIVEELQRENAELKEKLAEKCPRDTFDAAEAKRLQDLLKSVYGERSRLRKQMAELDASERETLLKISRKERDLERVSTISGDESKKAKISARIESLQGHRTEVQRQKQTVNEYLYSNNESVGRVQAEINRECEKTSASPALRMVLEAASEARKLETENAHLWKYSKHLLKYIKNQQKEINKSENIFKECLALVRRQHAMLRASNVLTPSLQEMYETIVRMAEGEKGVAWADQSLSQQSVDNSLTDVSTSTFTHTQLALFDNFVTHASPMRRTKEVQNGLMSRQDLSSSPCVPSATIGILANSVVRNKHVARCPQGSPERKCPQGSPERKTVTSPTPSEAISTPPGRRSPQSNGLSTPLNLAQLSSTKPGTPLFVTTPRTAFTPRNYLKFHPLAENRTHQNGLTFTPRFQNRPENLAARPTELPRKNDFSSPKLPRKNGFSSPSVEFNAGFAKPVMHSYLSPKPVVVDSSVRSLPKPAFLPYTSLAAVNKPRAPTPIDENSWSSSQSSTVSTKINTVLNRKGYLEPERRNAVKKGQSFQNSPHQSDSSSSASSSTGSGGHYLVGKRAEPYVIPTRLPQFGENRPDSRVSEPHTPTVQGHMPVSRTTSYAFEDNFVSPAHVKTVMGVPAYSMQAGGGRAQNSTVAQTVHYPTSPVHSPSPPSSSLSSQSLSQDQRSSPPSSVLSSHLSGLTSNLSGLTSISGTSNSSSSRLLSSPVAAALHSVRPSQPSIDQQLRDRDRPSSFVPPSLSNGAQSPPKPGRVSSPSPLKSYRISPRRRAKSAENLVLREPEKVSSPPTTTTTSPSKKSRSPLEKAKRLFGIRRNGESQYNRAQSVSMNDISQKPPTPVEEKNEDMSNPAGVSLSEGDADILNTTYIVEEHPPSKQAPAANGLRVPKVMHVKERRNGLNGTHKKRGLFNGNPFRHANEHNHMVAVEQKHRAVEKAQLQRRQETTAIPTRKQLTTREIGSSKLPNYLQMTRAAASKRVERPLVNKENKGQHTTEVTGKSKASKLLSHRPRDRDLNSGPLKTTATPQLVW